MFKASLQESKTVSLLFSVKVKMQFRPLRSVCMCKSGSSVCMCKSAVEYTWRLVGNVLLLQGTLGAQLTSADFLQQAP